jgi:microcystin-dependent protein
MGVLDTTYTFTATDVVTSTKLNNVIDQTTFTSSAIATGNTTLALSSGALKVNSSGITANELANDSVTTIKILDGNVTQAKTNNSLVPTGAIMAFGMNSVPTGWLECNGQSTSGYTALAALVGVTVPDLRGYFVRGTGTNSDGTVSGAFGAKQTDEFKSHNHNISVLGIAGGSLPGVTDANQNSTQSYATTNTGSTETRPRNIALLYCIKY